MVGVLILYTYSRLFRVFQLFKSFAIISAFSLVACILVVFQSAWASLAENFSINESVTVTKVRSGEYGSYSRVVLDTTWASKRKV